MTLLVERIEQHRTHIALWISRWRVESTNEIAPLVPFLFCRSHSRGTVRKRSSAQGLEDLIGQCPRRRVSAGLVRWPRYVSRQRRRCNERCHQSFQRQRRAHGLQRSGYRAVSDDEGQGRLLDRNHAPRRSRLSLLHGADRRRIRRRSIQPDISWRVARTERRRGSSFRRSTRTSAPSPTASIAPSQGFRWAQRRPSPSPWLILISFPPSAHSADRLRRTSK